MQLICNMSGRVNYPSSAVNRLLGEVDSGVVVKKNTLSKIVLGDEKPVNSAAVMEATEGKADKSDIYGLEARLNDIKPIEIVGDVVNAADEEDITAHGDLLRLKDRPRGLARGHKIMRTTHGLDSQITSDDIDTTFEVRYLFDLGGQVITLPAGAVLRFAGGKIVNGTIIGEMASIDAGNITIFDNIALQGTWVGEMNAMWIGARPNDAEFDNSAIVRRWAESYYATHRTLSFPTNIYYFGSPIVVEEQSGDAKRFLKIAAQNSKFRVNIPSDDSTFLTIIGTGTENFVLADVEINNVRKTTTTEGKIYSYSNTHCIAYRRTQMFELQNVNVKYFDKAIILSDVYYGSFVGNNALMYNRVGVYAIGGETPDDEGGSREVNTVDYGNLRIIGIGSRTAAYEHVHPQMDLETDDDYAMRIAEVGIDYHCCSNNSKFDGLTIEGVDYGMRFNAAAEWDHSWYTTGILNITGCYFERNRIYDIYVGTGYIDYMGYDWQYVLHFYYTIAIERCLFHMTDAPGIYLANVGTTVISACKHAPRLYLDRTTNLVPFGTIYHNGVGTITDNCGTFTIVSDTVGRIAPARSSSNAIEGLNVPTTLAANLANRSHGQGVAALIRRDLLPYTACRTQDNTALYRHVPTTYNVLDTPTLSLTNMTSNVNMRFDRFSKTMRVSCISGGKPMYVKAAYDDNALSMVTMGVRGIDMMRLRNMMSILPTKNDSGAWEYNMYVGFVRNIFPHKVYVNCRPATDEDAIYETVSGERIVPIFGTVFSGDKDGNNVGIVGFSLIAITRWGELCGEDKLDELKEMLLAKQGPSSRNMYYVELGTFQRVRTYMSTTSPSLTAIIRESDLLYGGRSYRDVRASASKDYFQHRFYVTTSGQRSSLLHINAICFNAIAGDDNYGQYQIFDGKEWHVLDDISRRFEYVGIGDTIGDRPHIADVIGQTFYNRATGILYTFDYEDANNKIHWRSSIGCVDSLDTPNGYTSSNQLSYSSELVAGERVACGDRIYVWDGEQFTLPTAQRSRPTLTEVDAGFSHYDRELGKPIWWNGIAWVDVNGVNV